MLSSTCCIRFKLYHQRGTARQTTSAPFWAPALLMGIGRRTESVFECVECMCVSVCSVCWRLHVAHVHETYYAQIDKLSSVHCVVYVLTHILAWYALHKYVCTLSTHFTYISSTSNTASLIYASRSIRKIHAEKRSRAESQRRAGKRPMVCFWSHARLWLDDVVTMKYPIECCCCTRSLYKYYVMVWAAHFAALLLHRSIAPFAPGKRDLDKVAHVHFTSNYRHVAKHTHKQHCKHNKARIYGIMHRKDHNTPFGLPAALCERL